MKLLLSAFLVAATATNAFGQSSSGPVQPSASPLLNGGYLQEVRKPLEQVFQFVLEGSSLKIDRESWERAAKEVPKEIQEPRNPFEGRFPAEGQNQFGRRLREAQPPSPLEAIFLQMQQQCQAGSRGHSSGGGRNTRVSERNFTSETLVGRLQMRGETTRLILEEAASPQRTLEFVVDSPNAFRIQIIHPDGDMMFVHQARNGSFATVGLLDGRLFAGQADSFVKFIHQHRQEADMRILPVLAHFGIRPLLSIDAPNVRKAVLAALSRSPETIAEGKKLIADLDSDDFTVREKANKSLVDRIGEFKDLVEAKLKDKSISPEVQARLQSVLSARSEAPRASQTVAAFELLDDAAYLVSLLDHATPAETGGVVRQLEKITGKKLGPNPAAWKEWAKKNPK